MWCRLRLLLYETCHQLRIFLPSVSSYLGYFDYRISYLCSFNYKDLDTCSFFSFLLKNLNKNDSKDTAGNQNSSNTAVNKNKDDLATVPPVLGKF